MPARCHDHKFDPISQHDYYRLLAAFVTTSRQERLNLPPAEAAGYERRQQEFSTSLASAQRALAEWIAPFVERHFLAKIDQLAISDQEKETLKKPADPADKQQKELLKTHNAKLQANDDDLRGLFSETERARWEELTTAVKRVEATRPAEPPRMLVLTDSQSQPLPSFFLERGEVDRKREPLTLGFLNVLAGDRPAEISRPAQAATTFQRAALCIG